MTTAKELTEHIAQQVHRFRNPSDGSFCYRRDGQAPSSLAASCDAALCLYCIDELPEAERQGRAGYVNSFQDEQTGWFRDERSNWTPGRQKPWLLGMALRALNALDAQPAFPARFLRAWENPEGMREWIRSGKDLMHLAIIWFRSGRRHYPFDGFERLFFETLAECRKRFTPDRPAFAAALAQHNAATGRLILKDAFHDLFAWYAAGRDIPGKELYIDWFLNEQDADGLFFQQGGSPAYSHMDGLQLLVEFSQRTDYRHEECLAAVERGLSAVLSENRFPVVWEPDSIHHLLARCETVAQAVRVLPGHPMAQSRWNCVWDLDMWRLEPAHFDTLCA